MNIQRLCGHWVRGGRVSETWTGAMNMWAFCTLLKGTSPAISLFISTFCNCDSNQKPTNPVPYEELPRWLKASTNNLRLQSSSSIISLMRLLKMIYKLFVGCHSAHSKERGGNINSLRTVEECGAMCAWQINKGDKSRLQRFNKRILRNQPSHVNSWFYWIKSCTASAFLLKPARQPDIRIQDGSQATPIPPHCLKSQGLRFFERFMTFRLLLTLGLFLIED